MLRRVPAALAWLAATSVSWTLAEDVYAPRPANEVRGEIMRWMSRRGIKDEQLMARTAEQWSTGAGTGRQVFERLIQTFCLLDAGTKRFVDACSPGSSARMVHGADALMGDDSDAFYTMNLRLFYARFLAQHMMYDEALAVFSRIDPARVVDPATCLFYQAVCQHQLLMKKEALETLEKLLHKTHGVDEPYARVGALMQDELASLDEQSLGGVSRKMKDSERRLDLGRGGQRVQKIQAEIIESLDEIIKKAEQQQMAQSQAGQAQNNTNRSSGPADEPGIKGATAPGNVDKKNYKKQGTWGSLPSKDEAPALNLLNREFPSNYRQAVEEYFKKLANRPGVKER